MTIRAPITRWHAQADGVAPDWEALRQWLGGPAGRSVQACHAMTPGTLVFAGEPVWQVRLAEELADELAEGEALPGGLAVPEGLAPAAAGQLVQVYRQVDEAGRLRRDVIRPMDADPVPGMVLLPAVWLAGRWQAPAVSPEQAEAFRTRQQQALPAGQTAVPVVDETK